MSTQKKNSPTPSASIQFQFEKMSHTNDIFNFHFFSENEQSNRHPQIQIIFISLFSVKIHLKSFSQHMHLSYSHAPHTFITFFVSMFSIQENSNFLFSFSLNLSEFVHLNWLHSSYNISSQSNVYNIHQYYTSLLADYFIFTINLQVKGVSTGYTKYVRVYNVGGVWMSWHYETNWLFHLWCQLESLDSLCVFTRFDGGSSGFVGSGS